MRSRYRRTVRRHRQSAAAACRSRAAAGFAGAGFAALTGCARSQPSSPTSGTNRTSARSSRLKSCSETRVIRTSSCTVRSLPTGMTRRPPIFNCSLSASGTFGPPAATTMRVIGHVLRPALGAVAMQHMHVAVAEIGEPRGRLFRELADALDGIDLAGNAREHGRRIARAGADLEHTLAALEPQRLDHEGDDVGLRDGLLGLDRQRRILVGEFPQIRPAENPRAERCASRRARSSIARRGRESRAPPCPHAGRQNRPLLLSA